MVLNSPEAKGRTCHGPSIELIFGEWILVSVCVCVCVCVRAHVCMYLWAWGVRIAELLL